MQRKWWIMAAGSLAFFFVTATTFTSLAVVLWPMSAELGFSGQDAGLSFSLVGLACGLANLVTAGIIKRLGSRFTMFIGALVMVAGFGLAAIVESRMPFFLACVLMGAGFTLLAPVPVIPLIAYWFREKSSRVLGFYFMTGAAGGIAGPAVVNFIVKASGSWRFHWAVMAASALVLGLFCLFAIRDLPADAPGQVAAPAVPAENGIVYTVGQAIRTWPFIWISLAMLVIQTSITTVHSILVPHVMLIGGSTDSAAFAMMLVGLFGTIAKGVSGAISERSSPKHLFTAGIAFQAIAFGLLYFWNDTTSADVFAVLLGIGWGLSWLTAHVLLLRWFGSSASGGISAIANLVTTFAVIGPTAAGRVKDETGGFAPIFMVFGLLLLAATIAALLMRAPRRQTTSTVSESAPLGVQPQSADA
ncbi:cyanate transporter [soil metagenome]